MYGKVLAILTAWALCVSYVAGDTNVLCAENVKTCQRTFSLAKFDDWDALVQYQGCVEVIECPEDSYGFNLRQNTLADIEDRMQNWGRYWDHNTAVAPTGGLWPLLLVVSLWHLLRPT